MKNPGYKALMISIVFIWVGMLLGISFLEAPLKFQAPNITLALGLGIGRLVFGALNKIELLFCGSLAILFFLHRSTKQPSIFIWLFITIVLFVQTLWLLPALDVRAETIISGRIPTDKSIHWMYVAAEVMKLISLVSLGYILLTDTFKRLQHA